jgi:hypothetical protein
LSSKIDPPFSLNFDPFRVFNIAVV